VEHIAIDLGGRESQICVRSADGSVVEERRYPTAKLDEYLAKRKRGSRVIFETCSESFGLADAAQKMGHEVRVVPGTLVKALGVGARGLKTDRRDAQVLSEASCRIELPSVHIPSKESRQLKTRLGMRDAIVGARTKLINTVRGWLRAEALRPRRGATSTFAERTRQLVGEVPSYVEAQLKMIEALSEQITAENRALKKLTAEHPVCRRLMTAPGVGPVTALRFVAAVDEISRFADAHKLESYFGLVPGEHSSSEYRHQLSITKAGSSAVRWTFVQAAWCIVRAHKSSPLQAWAVEVAKRRGKHVAAVALARKLVGILFAMWRDGCDFDEQKLRMA
jgi:transposase